MVETLQRLKLSPTESILRSHVPYLDQPLPLHADDLIDCTPGGGDASRHRCARGPGHRKVVGFIAHVIFIDKGDAVVRAHVIHGGSRRRRHFLKAAAAMAAQATVSERLWARRLDLPAENGAQAGSAVIGRPTRGGSTGVYFVGSLERRRFRRTGAALPGLVAVGVRRQFGPVFREDWHHV
jgi:hypothetical protein